MTGTEGVGVFEEFLARYADPVVAVREWWGVEPDAWQEEALRVVGGGGTHVKLSIRSCPGPGKTCLAAWAIWWKRVTRLGKTVVTAPGKPQLEDSLWPEVNLWGRRLPEAVRGLFEFQSDHIRLKAAPEECFISLRTARAETPENFRGVHSPDTMLVVDEASGVDDAIFEAMTGSESDPRFTWLLISNPTRRAGFFYDTHTTLADLWKTIKVGYQDSPRVSGQIVETVRRIYGEDSNAFRVQCLGEFPKEDEDTLIGYELVQGARGRDVVANPNTPVIWGVDVARYGSDDSALAKRKGNVQQGSVVRWHGRDIMQSAGRVKAEWDNIPTKQQPVEILVDVIGLGAGVCDRLRELGLPARGINVGETAATKAQYANLYSELWSRAREWLDRKDCRLEPGDETLAAELQIPRFGYLSNGKLKVEPTEEIKARGKRSPDTAAAWVLTFASEATTLAGGGGLKWSQPVKRGSTWVV